MSPEVFNDANVPMTSDEVTTLDKNIAKPMPKGTNNEPTIVDESMAKDVDIASELDNTHLAMGYNTS